MSFNEISLKWNGFHDNIVNKVKSLYTEEQSSDVTIISDGFSFKAHKVVLSANSVVFKTIFQQNPQKDPIIVLHDLNVEALKKLFTFMYNGEVNVSEDFLPSLLKVADALKICGLSTGLASNANQPTTPSPKKRKKNNDQSNNKSNNQMINNVIPKSEPIEATSSDFSGESPSEADLNIVDRQSVNSLEVILESTLSSEVVNEKKMNNGDKSFKNWLNEVTSSQPLVIDEKIDVDSITSIDKDCGDTDNDNEGVIPHRVADTLADSIDVIKDNSGSLYANPSFPCPFCPRIYNSWGYRRRHVKSRHITNRLTCKWCVSSHDSQSSWYAHATRIHGVSHEDARNSLVVMVEAHAVLTMDQPSVDQLLGQVDIPNTTTKCSTEVKVAAEVK